MRTIRFAAVAVLLLLTPGLVQGQSTSASVTGRITDPSKAIIPGAQVEAVNTATNLHYKTKSDHAGSYVLTNLPPGNYLLQVQKFGFKSIVKPNIVLHVQDVLEINFQMQLGSSSETVTVRGGAPLLDTTNGTVSTVVSQQFIQELPLNGRSFQSLLLLTPGVVMQTIQSGNLGQFSVNGQRADSNNVTVDGVSANFGLSTYYFMSESLGGAIPATNVFGGYGSLASVDGIKEFRVQTSSYAPEYGRQPGAQVAIVTRSGTNAYHGDVYDYLRNDVLDARDYFNVPPERKPALRQNDFGGVFGGPILKNRAFFFFSYEGLRLRKPENGTFSVPSLALRNSAPADVKPLLDAFPLPSPGAVVNPDGSASGRASWSDPGSMNATSLRIDTKLSHNLSLFGRYDYSPSRIDLRGGGPGGLSALSEVDSSLMRIQTFTLGLTWAMGLSAANSLHVNYSRDKGDGINTLTNFDGAVPPPSSYFFPAGYGYSLNNGQFALCVIAGCDYVNRQFLQVGRGNNSLNQMYEIVDTQSLYKGTHDIKFGIDLRRNSMFYWPFSYLSEPLPLDFNSLAAGNILEYQVLHSIPSSVRNYNISAFGEDAWRATPRLSLTYGIRWDVETPMMRNGGLPQVTASGLSQPDLSKVNFYLTYGHPYPTQWANFAPRIGAAYELQGKSGWETILRGGWGVFYNLISQSAGSLVYGWTGYPISGSKFGFSTTWPFPASVAAPPPIVFNPANGTSDMYNPNMKSPYSYEFNATLEQELGKNQVLSLSYVGSLGRKLALEESAYGLGPNRTASAQIEGINQGHSNYNALQAQFQRRSGSLQILASYTWSHSLDNSSENTAGYGSDNGVFGVSNFNINYGPSVFDVRQSGSAAITYRIPALERNGFTKAVTGGWSLDSVFTARSAMPSDIGGSVYGFLFGTSSTIFERPDRVAGQPLYLYGPQYPGGKAINLAAFAVPPADPALSTSTSYYPARQGNFGRYGLRNFPAWEEDLAVHRTFNLSERFKLQFRLEAFNVFNHPNMGFFGGSNSGTQQVALNIVPNGSGGWAFTPGYGQTLYGTNALVVNRTLGNALQGAYGGVNPLYSIGGNRSVQAALKLTF